MSSRRVRRQRDRRLLGMVCGLFCAHAHGFAYNSVADSGELVINGGDLPPVVWTSQTVSFTNGITDSRLAADISAVQETWTAVGAKLALRAGDARGTYCNHSDGVNMIVMDFSDCGESLGDILGLTHTTTRGVGQDQYIIDADILIKQFDPGSRTSWLPRSDVATNRRFTESNLCITQIDGSVQCDFYRVVLHEMGHAAGLAHPDEVGQVTNAVMNSGGSGLAKPFQLAADDRAGLLALYPSDRSASPRTPQPSSGSRTAGALGFWSLMLAAVALLCRRSQGSPKAKPGVSAAWRIERFG